MKHTSPRRGIALMMVMFVVALVAMMTGAFLQLNRSNLALLGSARDRALAYEGCLSAAEYCWSQLSNDMTWGATPFPSQSVALPSAGDPIMEATYSSTGTRQSNRIRGTFHYETPCNYEVRVYNNLAVANSWTVAGLEVPGNAVRLEVRATVGRSQRQLSLVMKEAPMFDAGAFSQSDMRVTLENDGPYANSAYWRIQSLDPLHNLARSNGDVYGSFNQEGAATPRTGFALSGLRNPTKAKPPYGAIRAQKDIILYDRASNRHSMSDLGKRTLQENRAKGNFDTNALPYRVPDLSPSALKVGRTDVHVPGGLYFFDKNQSAVTLKYFSNASANPYTDTPTDSWSWDGYGAGSQVDANGFKVDLQALQLKLPADRKAVVNNNEPFRLAGSHPPALVFENGSSSQNSGLLTTGSRGFIDIAGVVVGRGAIVSKDSNVSIHVGSDVDSTNAQPLALYAGRDIQLSQTQYNPAKLTASDFDTYKKTLTTQLNNVKWGNLSESDKLSKAGSIGTAHLGKTEFTPLLNSLLAEFSDVPDAVRDKVRQHSDKIYAGVPNPNYNPNPPPPVEGEAAPPAEPEFLVPPREVSVADFVRMKQYLGSAKLDRNESKLGDSTWLADGHASEVNPLIARSFDQLQQMAGFDWKWEDNEFKKNWNLVGNYVKNTNNPLREGEDPPMIFRGLVYAHEGGFSFDAKKRRLQIEGSIIARNGELNVLNARSVDFTYNPNFFDSMFDKSQFTYHRMEQVFFALR